MQITAMNPAQMMILESFASVKTDAELKALMKTLKFFYAKMLDSELDRLWDNGLFDQQVLDDLSTQHLRTPYRK